jgi:phage-related protein
MSDGDKDIVWLHGEVKSPPFSKAARIEAGLLLRRVQGGQKPSLPWSRPMPSIGARCHELRVVDETVSWRIIYRIDEDAIIVIDVFKKQTEQTPQKLINTCKRRLQIYDNTRNSNG